MPKDMFGTSPEEQQSHSEACWGSFRVQLELCLVQSKGTVQKPVGTKQTSKSTKEKLLIKVKV